MNSVRFVLAALLITTTATATAIPIGGIEFPDGAVSFADSVVSYTPGPDVGAGWDDGAEALGVPDFAGAGTAASLGNFGVLILQFTDNSLTTSGDATPDLHVFEVGGVTETFNLAISTDNVTYIDLGDVSGQPTSIDIDGVAGVTAGTQYSYVRLTDVLPNQSDDPFGEADIDAVGAISSAPPVLTSAPGSLALLAAGLLGAWRYRRVSNRRS